MGFDKIQALYWDFWLIPYYKVFVREGNQIVKVFNQRVINEEKGSTIALIDKQNKRCWWISRDYLMQKNRIIFHVSVNNAIPLILTSTERTKEICEGFINKTTKTEVLKIDKKKIKTEEIKEKLPDKTVEISYPPNVFYDEIESHFVSMTLAQPKDKWEQLKWVFIAGFIVLGLIAWQYFNSTGGVKPL